jgi:EpsI family protein
VPRSPQLPTTVIRTIVVTALVAATGLYLTTAMRAEEVPPREQLSTLPMAIGEWAGRREPDLTPDILAVLGADDYVTRSYRRSSADMIGLYIGYHASQRQGDAIHSPLNCLPGAGWQPLEQGRTVIPVRYNASDQTTTPIEVNRVVIGKGLDRNLVLYWYQSHRRVVASEYWGKVYTVLDSVRYHRTDAALVRIIVPIADDQSVERATQVGAEFARTLFPLLPRHLPS